MDAFQFLGGVRGPASPPARSFATPPHVPPPPAWQPSKLVSRLPVKIKRPSGLYGPVFGLLLLGAIAAGVWYGQLLDLVTPGSPRATAKAFMRSIYAGHIDQTEALCTAATKPLLAPLEQAATLAQRRSGTGPPGELSWWATAVQVTGDRATVTIAQTLTQGGSARSSEFPLTLVKENGEWKVDLAGEPDGGYKTVMGLSKLVKYR